MGGYGAGPYLRSIGARGVMHGYVHMGRSSRVRGTMAESNRGSVQSRFMLRPLDWK